jgi:hypothetical protein
MRPKKSSPWALAIHSPPMKAPGIIALTFGLGATALAADPVAAPAASAVPRALTYLTGKGIEWTEDRNCVSCHHVPMMIWTLREARAAGISIDEKAMAKGIEWALSAKVDATTFPAKKNDPQRDIVSLAGTYLAFAFAGTDSAPPEWWARQFKDAQEYQTPEGGWLKMTMGRTPILSNAPTHTTLFVAHALAGQPQRTTEPAIAASLEKALAWLATQPAEETTQYHALRLLLGTRLALAPQTTHSSFAWLRAEQQRDGGWSQAPGEPADAYATGQAVYAMLLAGTVRGDPAIQRARDFLAKTQAADGSWPMTSRPTATDTKGAGELEPITYIATAWAALALVRSMEGGGDR